MIALTVLTALAAAPCPPERCEADCLGGSAKACVAVAARVKSENPIKAAAFLQRACTAEDGPACASLAEQFSQGQGGLPADPAQARQLHGRACALKVGSSCLELGRQETREAAAAKTGAMTCAGLARAAAYLSIGCEAKTAEACTELATLHGTGGGVAADATQAAQLAKKGCDGGDKAGCRYWAWFLDEGLGEKKDPRRAAELLKTSAQARPLSAPPLCDDAPGVVALESVTPATEVWVDGFLLGAAPVVMRLAQGEHVVLARAPGRAPLRQPLSISRGFRGSQRLSWTATLSLESAPPGAEVQVDGKPVGVTPVSAALAPGVHEVTASLSGFTPGRRVVSLAEGEAKLERFELEARAGTVSIRSEPPGAQLELDGVVVGTTPWTGELRPGPHRVKATLERFLPAEQTLMLSPTGPSSLDLVLKADPRFVPTKLVVDSEPAGATVSVDGAAVGTTPWTGETTRGTHELRLELSGYRVELRTATTSPAAPFQLKVRLKPEPRAEDTPVSWRVSSEPGGAMVALDGKQVGKTPWSGKALPGQHEVMLTLAGYEPYTDVSSPPEPVSATLKPLPTGFTLTLDPRPSNVRVTVDGTPLEAEGGRYAVTPGRHALEVTADGFVAARTTVKTVLGVVGEVTLKLARAPEVPRQGLIITSTPPGADVLIDDQRVGVTPYSGPAPQPGEHRLVVMLAGYAPGSVPVSVPRKSKTPWLLEQAVVLEALPVSVAIETTPPGAKVFIDGEVRGETPAMLKLPVGTHRVYLTSAGFATVDESREVQPLSSPRWSWSLVSTAPVPAVVEAPPPVQAPEPPPPPPVAAEPERPVDVADPAVPLAAKQASLEAVKDPEQLLKQIGTVLPQEQRVALCRAFSGRVPVSSLAVTSADVNDEVTAGRVLVDEKELGVTPFQGLVPTCSARLRVVREAGDYEEALQLTAMVSKQVAVRRGGTPRFSSVSLMGDLQVFAEPVQYLLSGAPSPQSVLVGGGLRWDRWGTLIHGSIGLSAQQLYSPLASQLLATAIPVVPSLDLFLGLHFRAGGTGPVMGLFGLDVGVWQWAHPTARLNLGLRLGPLVLVATFDMRYLWPFTVIALAPAIGANPLSFGGTVSIGVAW